MSEKTKKLEQLVRIKDDCLVLCSGLPRPYICQVVAAFLRVHNRAVESIADQCLLRHLVIHPFSV